MNKIATTLVIGLFGLPAMGYADDMSLNQVPHNVQHSFDCTMKEDSTYAELFEASADWLKEARRQEGGQDTEVHLQFPLAGLEGVRPFKYVVTSSSLTEWGSFYDHYVDSGASNADEPWEQFATCTDSTLYMNWDIQPTK